MNIWESLLYGLISGLTEFLPVSSKGHQAVLKELFGVTDAEPLRDIMIRISFLLAIIICCGTYIEKLRRDQKTGRRSRRNRFIDSSTAYDLQIIKTAGSSMLAVMLLAGFTGSFAGNLAMVALFFVINGLALYIPEHLPHSNKDASKMSALDGLLIGISSALSILPGISRVGCSLSCSIARGADKQKALNWVLVLSIPATVLWLVFDLISLFTVGIGYLTFQIFLGYLLSAMVAFAAACCGIYIIRFITLRSDISFFGYYCWGMALLSFILYLTA